MPQATLRTNDGNPYLYLEGATGSMALGVDTTNNEQVNLVTSDAVQNVDPTSSTPSIAVQSTTPGDIEFSPKGIGQSTFVNGDVEILGSAGSAGNLLMQDTAAAGISGVIEFGGNRFIHNFGSNNTFVGENAGNFSISMGDNVAVGSTALLAATSAQANTCVGVSSGAGITTSDINTAIGSSSLSSLTTGSGSNVAIGSVSLGALATGQLNTALGYRAGVNYTGAESSNIIIGNTGTLGESNKIRIGTQGALPGQQNQCFIAGINGTTVTAAGSVVVSSSGQLGSSTSFATTWNDVTGTSASMAVNNGYVADNAGLVTLTLPTTAAFGSRFEIVGKGAGGWIIAQNAGQTIHFNSLDTTTGAGGSLASTLRYNCVELICVTANTDFVVKDSSGNLTVV